MHDHAVPSLPLSYPPSFMMDEMPNSLHLLQVQFTMVKTMMLFTVVVVRHKKPTFREILSILQISIKVGEVSPSLFSSILPYLPFPLLPHDRCNSKPRVV